MAPQKDARVGFSPQLKENGNAEGGSDIDSLRAFQLLGNLPILLHQDQSRPKRVLVLAFGMGITLGTTLDQDSQSVIAVELVPEVLDAARFFAQYNHNPLDNRKAKVYIEDARNFLLTTQEKFDIVVLDGTHPRNGDSWMLYTQECYQLVKRVLAPGGIAAQWVPLHSLEFQHYLSIVKTLQSVFPHLTLWSPPSSHTVLVATPEQTIIDLGHVRRRMVDPAVHRNFEAAEMSDEYALLSYFIAGEETLAKYARLAPINTDDLCVVQFTKYFVRAKELAGLYRSLTRIKQSPLPLIVNRGATAEEAAACEKRISRTYQASILVRDGYTLLKNNYGTRAMSVFQKAYKLNPHDRDAALFLGRAAYRLRTKVDLPLD